MAVVLEPINGKSLKCPSHLFMVFQFLNTIFFLGYLSVDTQILTLWAEIANGTRAVSNKNHHIYQHKAKESVFAA